MQDRIAETAYITKYVLTEGIIVCHAGYFSSDGFYHINLKNSFDIFNKKEAWRTLEEAKADAEKRRLRKIASLKKQLDKLKKLEVKVREDFFK